MVLKWYCGIDRGSDRGSDRGIVVVMSMSNTEEGAGKGITISRKVR